MVWNFIKRITGQLTETERFGDTKAADMGASHQGMARVEQSHKDAKAKRVKIKAHEDLAKSMLVKIGEHDKKFRANKNMSLGQLAAMRQDVDQIPGLLNGVKKDRVNDLSKINGAPSNFAKVFGSIQLKLRSINQQIGPDVDRALASLGQQQNKLSQQGAALNEILASGFNISKSACELDNDIADLELKIVDDDIDPALSKKARELQQLARKLRKELTAVSKTVTDVSKNARSARRGLRYAFRDANLIKIIHNAKGEANDQIEALKTLGEELTRAAERIGSQVSERIEVVMDRLAEKDNLVMKSEAAMQSELKSVSSDLDDLGNELDEIAKFEEYEGPILEATAAGKKRGY
jgi:hypothetical protein